MAIKGINVCSDNGKYFTLKNFKTATKKARGVFASEKEIGFGVGIKSEGQILKNGLKAVKIYTVFDKLFICTLSGEVYSQKGGTLNKIRIPAFKDVPKIYPIIYDKKESALIVSDGYNYVVNDNINYVGVPKSTTVASFKDGLYFGYKRRIFACLNKDFTLFNTDFLSFETIAIPQRLDVIEKLIPLKGGLLAVCKRGFALIERKSDELGLSFTPLDVDPVKIEEDTVVKIGEEIFFLSNGRLCVYKSQKVEVLASLLDGEAFTKISHAGASGDYYLLPGIFFDGDIGLFVYDTKNNQCTFVDFREKLITTDGVVLEKDGKLGSIKKDGQTTCAWQSVETDFEEENKKTIYQIYVKCSGNCTLTVTGDKRSKTFSLKKGGNLLNVNLYAQNFGFGFEGDKTAFPITALKVKYGI